MPLNLLEFLSKLCLELFLVLPLKKDNLSTTDKQLVPKVSSLWRFHCKLSKIILKRDKSLPFTKSKQSSSYNEEPTELKKFNIHFF